LLLLQEFKQLGIELHYSQSGRKVDLSNPVEALMQSIEGWQSGEDHREVVGRLIEGRYSRARNGYVVPHGVTLYGYDKIKKDKKCYFEINEAEATVVRLIFQWYVYGDETGKKLSMLAIAERLAHMGIGTRSGKRWWRASVRGVLVNESYAGTWYYGRSSERIAVAIPAIVDRETWKAAQERVVYNTGFALRNRKPGRYLMSGRVKCGDCGYKMTGQTTQSGHGYYRCPTNLDSEHGNECHLPGFRSAVVDTNVWTTLEEIVSDKNRLLDGLRGYQSQQESKVEPIRRELAYVEQLIKEKNAEWESAYLEQKLLTSERAKARKAIEIDQIEKVLNGLEVKKAGLLAQLEGESLAEQQINNIVRFAYQVYQDMKALRQAEQEGNATPELRLKVFDAKRKLLEFLDVQITLFIQDGKRKGVMTAKFCAEGEPFMVELDNFYEFYYNKY
jgi:site-specific DNA recombinase